MLYVIATKPVDTYEDKRCSLREHNKMMLHGNPQIPWNLKVAKYVAGKLDHYLFFQVAGYRLNTYWE